MSTNQPSRGYGGAVTSNDSSSLFDSIVASAPPKPSRARSDKAFMPPPPLPPPKKGGPPSVTSTAKPFQQATQERGDEKEKQHLEAPEKRKASSDASFFLPSTSRHSSTSSLIGHVEKTTLHEDAPNSSASARDPDPYDMNELDAVADEQPVKKARGDADEPLVPKKASRPVYRHTWAAKSEKNDEDEEEGDSAESVVNRQTTSAAIVVQGVPSSTTLTTSIRVPHQAPAVVRQTSAARALERGAHDDFQQDLDYIFKDLGASGSSANLQCLSMVALARRSLDADFRAFVRNKARLNAVLERMAKSVRDANTGLCAALVLYILSRDTASLQLEPSSLSLYVQLIRFDKLPFDAKNSQLKLVWSVLCEWVDTVKSTMREGQEIQFELCEETLTPCMLAVESLAFALARNESTRLRDGLRDTRVLHVLAQKVDGLIDQLEKVGGGSEHLSTVTFLCRVFRIFESATLLNKSNQSVLVGGRSGQLLVSCVRSLAHLERTLPGADSQLAPRLLSLLTSTTGLLMNLSNENELACSRLGESSGCLSTCASLLVHILPCHCPAARRFDLSVKLCSLLINLVERSQSNRQRLLALDVDLWESGDKKPVKMSLLKASCKLFVRHEAAAAALDEEMDKEMFVMEPEDGDEGGAESNDEDDDDDEDSSSDTETGRRNLRTQGKPKQQPEPELSEAELMGAVRSVMTKASTHMEDCVLSCFFALLAGCLLQQNEPRVRDVLQEMPTGSLQPMIDQLLRFIEFLKLTGSKQSFLSIEKILDLLHKLNNSSASAATATG